MDRIELFETPTATLSSRRRVDGVRCAATFGFHTGINGVIGHMLDVFFEEPYLEQ